MSKMYTLGLILWATLTASFVYGETHLHVVSIYESRDDHSADFHPRGDVAVNVDTPGAVTLLLSSYEPTRWRVNVARGTIVTNVILNGYYAQTVSVGNPNTSGRGSFPARINSFYFDDGTSRHRSRPLINDPIYAFTSSYDTFNQTERWAQSLIQEGQRLSQRSLTSYQSAYRQNRFDISFAPTNLAPTGTLNEAPIVAFGFNIGNGFVATWDFPAIPKNRSFGNFEIELIDGVTGKPQLAFSGGNTRPIILEPADRGTQIRFRVRMVYQEADRHGQLLRGPWSRSNRVNIPLDLEIR